MGAVVDEDPSEGGKGAGGDVGRQFGERSECGKEEAAEKVRGVGVESLPDGLLGEGASAEVGDGGGDQTEGAGRGGEKA